MTDFHFRRINISKPSDREALNDVNILDVRQLLQFMTLLWQVDGSVVKFFHPHSIFSFLDTLLHKLSREKPQEDSSDDDNFEDILPALVTCLSAMELRKRRDETFSEVKKVWQDGLVWKLMVDCSPEDMLATCTSDIVLDYTYRLTSAQARLQLTS